MRPLQQSIGLGLILRRNIIRPIFLGSMFGVWIVSLGFLIVSIVMAGSEFRHEGKVKTEQKWDYAYKNLTLDARDVSKAELNVTNISVYRHDLPEVRVEVIREAQGNSSEDARRNAGMIAYTYELNDSTLTLDENFTFGRRQAMDCFQQIVDCIVCELSEIVAFPIVPSPRFK